MGLSGDLNGDYLIAPQCLAWDNFQILCFGPKGNTLDQNAEFGNIVIYHICNSFYYPFGKPKNELAIFDLVS